MTFAVQIRYFGCMQRIHSRLNRNRTPGAQRNARVTQLARATPPRRPKEEVKLALLHNPDGAEVLTALKKVWPPSPQRNALNISSLLGANAYGGSSTDAEVHAPYSFYAVHVPLPSIVNQ